jgi:uncharacterized protein YqiB (DUF1249 family)
LSVFESRTQQLDLARLHKECEHNYQRLRRVISDSKLLGACFSLRYKDEPRAGIELKIIEVSKYTSTVQIVADRAGPMWLPEIEIKVRIYRDAKMAEVIEWCTDRTIPWAMVEKNGMQARDEKWQWNMFLSELLCHGLRHGITELEA